ncbi:MAG: MFS transporter, partial [Solirubrobacteraceae bacterium]
MGLTANARARARVGLGGMGPFLFAAAAMFTAMYSTQAILPELGRDFSVAPSQTGLTVSVVIGALAVGAWFWGPLSDRIGRRASLVLASGALVVPSLGVAVAPSFAVLLAMRAAQGLCMPGLLTVGVPYVTEAFNERIGSRAMGMYVSALVLGGLVGRVGVALLTAATSWRVALGAVALLPLAATLVMRRSLPPETPGPPSAGLSAATLRRLLGNRALVAACLTG